MSHANNLSKRTLFKKKLHTIAAVPFPIICYVYQECRQGRNYAFFLLSSDMNIGLSIELCYHKSLLHYHDAFIIRESVLLMHIFVSKGRKIALALNQLSLHSWILERGLWVNASCHPLHGFKGLGHVTEDREDQKHQQLQKNSERSGLPMWMFTRHHTLWQVVRSESV